MYRMLLAIVAASAGHVPKKAEEFLAPKGFHKAMEGYRFNEALGALWSVASDLNQRVEQVKPWVLQKEGETEALALFLDEMIEGLRTIAHWLSPFMPTTADRLGNMFVAGRTIERGDPLFPRLD